MITLSLAKAERFFLLRESLQLNQKVWPCLLSFIWVYHTYLLYEILLTDKHSWRFHFPPGSL